ncbi:uncharacterized protein [Equus przewalskii]|uniref:Uncharacterized protein n=1 Tax=Equus przewalskii TaxID=9798 RepID=A0ABM4MAN3_EQUPR
MAVDLRHRGPQVTPRGVFSSIMEFMMLVLQVGTQVSSAGTSGMLCPPKLCQAVTLGNRVCGQRPYYPHAGLACPSLNFFLLLVTFSLGDSVEVLSLLLRPHLCAIIQRPQQGLLFWNPLCQGMALPAPGQPNPNAKNSPEPPFPPSQCPLGVDLLTIFPPLLFLRHHLVQTLVASPLGPATPSSLFFLLQFTTTPLSRASQFPSGLCPASTPPVAAPSLQKFTLLRGAHKAFVMSLWPPLPPLPTPTFTPGSWNHLQLPTSTVNTSCPALVILHNAGQASPPPGSLPRCPKCNSEASFTPWMYSFTVTPGTLHHECFLTSSSHPLTVSSSSLWTVSYSHSKPSLWLDMWPTEGTRRHDCPEPWDATPG